MKCSVVGWLNGLLVAWSGLSLFASTPAMAADWLQFRGPNAAGHAAGGEPYPTEIGPDSHVIWKTDLPPGHSSPVVTEKQIFVTAAQNERLVTIALDRTTGRQQWLVEAPHGKREDIHSIGSHAQSTPASDGQMVVSFFGSCGLLAYDLSGKELWRVAMGPFNNDFGAASSPIIVDDLVILSQDHDTDSFLMAVDKRSGKTVWRTERGEFPRGFATPVIWTNNGQKQIVIAGTLRVVGYDLKTGKEAWTVRGISRTVCATPVVGADGNLYLAGWSAGGDPGERIRVEPFDTLVVQADKNKDGALVEDELPEGAIRQRFSQVDRNNDQRLTRVEYEFFRSLFDQSQNVVIAIRPGPMGDASESHVIWRQDRHVPFCASPLWANDLVFTIRDGGILASLDAKTGKLVKQSRLAATNNYYASPVLAGGNIYLLNDEGKLTVVSGQGAWKVVHTADFGQPTYATPAAVDGRIYLRTATALYCFGQ
ncbi:MAG: hypothetical protein RIS70_1981 [Planctomycetota bacterium]